MMRMLMIVAFGMSFVPAVAMADGNLGEKSLKDTNLSGAQCSLMRKDVETQSSSQQQTVDTNKGSTAGDAR